MRSFALALPVCSLSLLALACGAKVAADGSNGAAGGPTAPVPDLACDMVSAGIHVCAAYDNLTPDLKTSATTACTGGGGTVVTACSTADALGSCAFTISGLSMVEVFYAGGGITLDEAMQACTASGGVWTGA